MNYANSLRVIGQSLDTANVRIFRLGTQGQDYVVQSQYFEEHTEYFLQRAQVRYEVRTGHDDNLHANASFRLNSNHIKKLNHLGRLQRNFNPYPSAHGHVGLSQLLRSLGDFLDHKGAQAFQINWRDNSISVDFRTSSIQSESRMFTIERLQRLSSVAKFQLGRSFRSYSQPHN